MERPCHPWHCFLPCNCPGHTPPLGSRSGRCVWSHLWEQSQWKRYVKTLKNMTSTTHRHRYEYIYNWIYQYIYDYMSLLYVIIIIITTTIILILIMIFGWQAWHPFRISNKVSMHSLFWTRFDGCVAIEWWDRQPWHSVTLSAKVRIRNSSVVWHTRILCTTTLCLPYFSPHFVVLSSNKKLYTSI